MVIKEIDVSKPVFLLFYDGFELKAREKLGLRLFHAARCKLRSVVRRLRGKQVNTGFYEAFLAIVLGLRKLGFEVRINDFSSARRDPKYPIGLAGYPDVFEHVQLPNPMIFGPGDPGYPDKAAAVTEKSSTRFIIQPSDWFVEYYRPYCGDKMLRCPVGIDVDAMPDFSGSQKSCDVLIYDKIRWHRSETVPRILGSLLEALSDRSLSYRIIRYGEHVQTEFFDNLRVSKSMAFLCEHETQGLACEEALAVNVPVFAWDEGTLVDPKQRIFALDNLRVSSVPYFDERCGLTFTSADLEVQFDKFWSKLPLYSPREFIRETLAPELTARVFAKAYQSMVSAKEAQRDIARTLAGCEHA